MKTDLNHVQFIEIKQLNERMSSSPAKSIEDVIAELRECILSLKPAGADGFEGFLRIVLTSLTGIPFRLAASGLQGGIDGSAVFSSDAVCFEAKRYDNSVPRTEILTKIVDLARKTDHADRLWILGASTAVSTQLADDVRFAGENNATSTLILDWIAAPLPILAVAVAAAGDGAVDFLAANYDPKQGKPERSKAELKALCESISRHTSYKDVLGRLKLELDATTLATQRAVKANQTWRGKCFASANLARDRLGQALNVTAHPDLPPLRSNLKGAIESAIKERRDVVLLGGEGQGKSWLAAQACNQHDGIALFISAERFDGIAPTDTREFIVDLLVEQTGDAPEEAIKKRWRHRFDAWHRTPPACPLLLVVDGINQRRQRRWDKFLNSLQYELKAIGGVLLVTVRPQFWKTEIAPGVIFQPALLDVPEWDPGERDALLNYYGIQQEWLDTTTLTTLRNPRLLAIAVSTLPHEESTVWKSLTTDRLLFEHLRTSQRENFEAETFKELTGRLSEHANLVLERVRASSNAPPQHFEEDSAAVIETRFFRTLPGPGATYELRNEGLTLALGYALVDQLWQAQRQGASLESQIARLIDPIEAMDRTVDVVFASLMIASLDDSRFDAAIFGSILDAFSHLQNVDEGRFNEFVDIVRHQAAPYFSTVMSLCLDRVRRINQDWFYHAALTVSKTTDGWPVAEAAIHKWLHCYNKDAEDQANRFPKRNSADDERRLKRSKDEIDEVMSSLSPFEREVLSQMEVVKGDTDTLYSLALELLAGRPLAGFANSFIALGLGLALDMNIYGARKSFQQLTTFNRVDCEAAQNAFIEAVVPLRSERTSKAGQWTIVRMLFASGDETAAKEASELAQQLRSTWPRFEMPAENEWKQTKVADPDAAIPVNLDEGLLHFREVDPDTILQAMGLGAEDHSYREFLPVACRFAQEAAIEKVQSLLDGLLTRNGMPLRQIIFNGQEMIPLVSAELASAVVERLTGGDMLASFPDEEQSSLRMILFNYVAHQLNEADQLTCIASSAFGPDIILEASFSIKTQRAEDIAVSLASALSQDDERATYGVLTATLYGQTVVSAKLEPLILECLGAETSRLRAIAFELASVENLATVRQAHVQSDWSVQKANEKTFESWFGSLLLIDAGVNGEIDTERMLRRISPMTWFVAVECIGGMAAPLAEYFLLQVQSAIGATENISPPALELTLSTVQPAPYPLLSVDESERNDGRFPKEKSLRDI